MRKGGMVSLNWAQRRSRGVEKAPICEVGSVNQSLRETCSGSLVSPPTLGFLRGILFW